MDVPQKTLSQRSGQCENPENYHHLYTMRFLFPDPWPLPDTFIIGPPLLEPEKNMYFTRVV